MHAVRRRLGLVDVTQTDDSQNQPHLECANQPTANPSQPPSTSTRAQRPHLVLLLSLLNEFSAQSLPESLPVPLVPRGGSKRLRSACTICENHQKFKIASATFEVKYIAPSQKGRYRTVMNAVVCPTGSSRTPLLSSCADLSVRICGVV